MVPSSPDDSDTAPGDTGTTGGLSELSETELYNLVHAATEDAILGALGTLLLVTVGIVLVSTGLSALFASMGPVPSTLGVVSVVVGAYLVTSSLGFVPPLRQWI